MNRSILGYLCAALAGAALSGACSGLEAPSLEGCGTGTDVAVLGKTYCFFSEQAISETGFMCPEDFAFGQQFGNGTLCRDAQEAIESQILENIGEVLGLNLLCAPGSTFCGEFGVNVYQCNVNGTAACLTDQCAAAPLEGLCVEGVCTAPCGTAGGSAGCEFFPVDLDNATIDCDGAPGGEICDAAAEQFSVAVNNPSASDSVTVVITQAAVAAIPNGTCNAPANVEQPAEVLATATIEPLSAALIDLPSDRGVDGSVLAPLAFRLVTDIPVIVSQFNPLVAVDAFSTDGSMLAATADAGLEYRAVSRLQVESELAGYVTVVGIDSDPTTVTVFATVDLAGGPGVPAMATGESRDFVLNRFDVLSLQADGVDVDLTGTRVLADQPVVVFGGHEAASAPSPNPIGGTTPCCADHLEAQLPPVSAWQTDIHAARSFPLAPFSGDRWRILAHTDGTTVALEPPVAVVPTLNAGEFFEFEADDISVSASAPILLVQYLASAEQAGGETGDPSMIIPAPEARLRNFHSFWSPDTYADNYVSLTLPDAGFATLDGFDLANLIAQVQPFEAYNEPIGVSGWRAFQFHVNPGFHVIECPQTCAALIHGYDEFVSYGFSAGVGP